MLEVMISVFTTLLVVIASFWVAVYAIRVGWIPIRVATHDEKINQLNQQIENLTAIVTDTKKERNDLLERLSKAYRRIENLEHDAESLRAKLSDLQLQIQSQIPKEFVRVLAIWPTTNPPLNQNGERIAIYNAGIDYLALHGNNAVKQSIVREMRNGNYIIVEIGAHGSRDGIMLSDGLATAGFWQRIFTNSSARIVILLACYSDNEIADAFLRAGVKYVISIMDKIEDDIAVQFVKAFYRNYAEGLDVEQAFSDAKLIIDFKKAESIVLRTKNQA